MTRARSLSLLANANAFTVSGSNNVGIGSTLPDGKLDVDGDILVGTAITIGKVSGIISATSYRGDGSQLTGVDSSNLIDSGDTNRVAANTSGIVVTGIATVTGNMNVGGVLTYDDVTNVDSLGIITARSHVSIADSILHTGDTDTSIRFPSANTFTVETGGSEALRVDSSQRLLVGTTSFTGEASAVLEGSSAGDNVQAQIWLNRGAANPVVDLLLGMINFGDSDAEGHMGAKIDVRTDGNWSAGNYPSRLMFHTTASSASSPTERLRITSGGNVGINEDAPEQRLHVGGDVEIGFASPTDAARQIIFDANRSSADATIANINWQWNSTSVAQIRGITGADTTNKDDAHLAFFTAAAGSLVERLRITSGGVLLAGATASVGEGGTPADLNSTEIGRGYINIARDDTAAADHILFGKNGSVASSIGTDTTNTLVFKIGTTERARFDSSGRFGINQSSPQRILHIGESGTAEANLRIQGGADYFEFRVKDSDNALTIHRNIAGGGSNEDLRINSSGDVLPGGDDSQDLGSTSKRWANIYSADLQLSNEGKSNDVDGTWGQYTIQEGENDLFLLNRRNGKTYKFVLEEVN